MIRDSFLLRIALFAERHYRGIFAVTLVVVVVSGFFAARVRFDPDVLNLLPDDDPVVAAFRDALSEFGGLNLLLVVVRVPEAAVIDPYHDLVDRLGPAIEELEAIEYVDHRVPEPLELVRSFFPDAAYFLDEEARREVERRLGSDGIERRVAELRRQLTTPQALVRKDLMLLDPVGVSEILLAELTRGRGSLGVDWSSGYYQSKDRRRILLLAKPRRPAQDLDFARRLVPEVETVVERAVAEWRAEQEAEPELGGETAPPVEVVLGGGYVTTVDDTALIRRDIVRQAVGSLVIVLALFVFAFRRLGLVLYALVPLGAGLIMTFGFAGAAVGTLSSATSGFAALLIGLGIDFVIVSYGRYVEERHRGEDESTALRRMTGSCGRAVVVGGVTSAATFYAFAITEFTGLRQMGLLTGTGILFCMAMVLVLLPAMLAWSHERQRRRDVEPSLYVHGFGAGHLVSWSVRWPGRTLVVGLAVTVAAGLLLTQLSFEEGIRNMRSPTNRGVRVEREVSEHFGSNFEYMMLVLRGESLGEVLEASAEAADRFGELVDGEVLTGVDSIAQILPPPAQQRDVLGWLERGRASWLDPARIRGAFTASFAAEGLRAEPFAEGLGLLDAALSPTEPLGLDDLEENPTASRLLERYLRPTDDGGWKSILYLYTPPEIWKRRPPPQVEAVAAELGPRAVLTGVNVVSRNLRQQVWKDAVVAAIVGTLAVGVLLFLDYRRLGDTILTLVPLAIGILWMLGGMVVLGISMNFMNIFVTTMIIGIGVDYGVHMLHRFRELSAAGADAPATVAGLAETGRAIGMAAVTTMVGFGSLVLSSYPGLRSIGYLAILGALFTSVIAITLLPAYLVSRRVG